MGENFKVPKTGLGVCATTKLNYSLLRNSTTAPKASPRNRDGTAITFNLSLYQNSNKSMTTKSGFSVLKYIENKSLPTMTMTGTNVVNSSVRNSKEVTKSE